MSFSSEIKQELCKNVPEAGCCRRAFFYGMLLFGRSFSVGSMSFTTENQEIAKLYALLVEEFCKICPQVAVSPKGKTAVSIEEKKDRLAVLEQFGHNPKEVTLKINHSVFECEECQGAFFAGAFLACGTISSPQKDYHLEFVVPYYNLSRSLIRLMADFDLEPKLVNRKGYSIVYFKESESIEGCLYRMGAHSGAFEIMNIKVFKDFRNKANRVSNCETANIERMAAAAVPQMYAIQFITQKKGFSFLSEELQEIAQLRLDNPEASLQELAALTTEGLSRSGVNHRLKRIEKIARDLEG